MANPSKQKGTAEETAVVTALNEGYGMPAARRTPASSTYDIIVEGDFRDDPIDVLVTRPDRGERLYTLREKDFISLTIDDERVMHIEVKRYARFALHTIFEKKFGGSR
jgi:hypothetical protein